MTILQDAPCSRLIGRARELETVDRELELAGAGTPRCITLVGEPGIGKSRLAREAARLAAGRNFAVMAGQCFPDDASTPYAPFGDILARRLVAEPALTGPTRARR